MKPTCGLRTLLSPLFRFQNFFFFVNTQGGSLCTLIPPRRVFSAGHSPDVVVCNLCHVLVGRVGVVHLPVRLWFTEGLLSAGTLNLQGRWRKSGVWQERERRKRLQITQCFFLKLKGNVLTFESWQVTPSVCWLAFSCWMSLWTSFFVLKIQRCNCTTVLLGGRVSSTTNKNRQRCEHQKMKQSQVKTQCIHSLILKLDF